MSISRKVTRLINRVIRGSGAHLVHERDVDWTRNQHCFHLAGQYYPMFYHHFNCGWPPLPPTERSVEMALADRWLQGVNTAEAYEIGAVTPYYWPKRVSRIVDPGDSHPLVTHRTSLFELDFTGVPVLSISTFEHIGTGEYGVTSDEKSGRDAFKKIFNESPQFLITVPTGYSPGLDEYLFESGKPSDVSIAFLIREENGLTWREEPCHKNARRNYSSGGGQSVSGLRANYRWANAVAVFERGGILIPNDAQDQCRLTPESTGTMARTS